jgi:hypothetical protein
MANLRRQNPERVEAEAATYAMYKNRRGGGGDDNDYTTTERYNEGGDLRRKNHLNFSLCFSLSL